MRATFNTMLERISNSIMSMGFSSMYTVLLDIAVMGVVDTFRPGLIIESLEYKHVSHHTTEV